MAKYCDQCGALLTQKKVENEGLIPYCQGCEQLKFPKFNVAMSSIILNPQQDKLLLINQYNYPGYILTAGYVSLGEAVEETVRREIKEELGLTVVTAKFLRSEYYPPSQTLMMNFEAIVMVEDFCLNQEVDEAKWFSFSEAKEAIISGSLAERFLLTYLAEQSV